MERIKKQLEAGRVAQVIAALKAHGDRDKAVAICIGYYEVSALLAARCCLENMSWPDFVEWRACRTTVA